MVKIFVIRSGADKEKADSICKELENMNKDANVLVLNNATGLMSKFWRFDAYNKITKSQIVLFIVGEKSHTSKNIDIELLNAMKKNKTIMLLKLNKNNLVNRVLYKQDEFSNRELLQAKEITSIKEVSDSITKYQQQDYAVLNIDDLEKLDKNQLFEQYKLFVNTSETLVQRRQNVSNFYISVNTALITTSGIASALASNIKQSAIIALCISILGVVLTVAWIKVLDSYGRLNGCKIKVISILEKKLPARLYDAEWEIMSDKLSNKKYTTFTESEAKIPKILRIIYILGVIISVYILIAENISIL